MSKLTEVRLRPTEPLRTRERNIETYRDDEPLGLGGMATVRRGEDTDLGREIAYKELHDELLDHDQARAFFIGEAQITAQLDHPNIVPVYEIGRDKKNTGATDQRDSLYFTMKRIRGRTLEDLLSETPAGRRDERTSFELLQIFLKVCNAIDYAHSHSVIHRDIKPENIMVGDFGEVYVLDWGVALIKPDMEVIVEGAVPSPVSTWEKENEIVGTPHYMPPEQACGLPDETDERSDIFALGGCLYEIITGTSPYIIDDDSTTEPLIQALKCEVEPPEKRADFRVPTQLGRIAVKALAKEKRDRYQTVRELSEAIEKFIQTYSFFPEVTFNAGDNIVVEGETSSSAYVMVRGVAEVLCRKGREQVHVRELNAGDVFGEIAVFTNLPRTATVRAVTEVSVVEIPGERLKDDSGSGFWSNLFTKALAERFLAQERRLKFLEESLQRKQQGAE